MKIPIPNDWNESDGYAVLFTCVPNSTEWLAIYTGMFYQITYWTAWDKDTGSINGAKAIANQVYEELCMANCADIVNELKRIADALAGDGISTEGINDLNNKLDTLITHIDQIEEIQNQQTLIFGGDGVTVLPTLGGGA